MRGTAITATPLCAVFAPTLTRQLITRERLLQRTPGLTAARQAAQGAASTQAMVAVPARVAAPALHFRPAHALTRQRVTGGAWNGAGGATGAGQAESTGLQAIGAGGTSIAEEALDAVPALTLTSEGVAELVE